MLVGEVGGVSVDVGDFTVLVEGGEEEERRGASILPVPVVAMPSRPSGREGSALVGAGPGLGNFLDPRAIYPAGSALQAVMMPDSASECVVVVAGSSEEKGVWWWLGEEEEEGEGMVW